MAMMVPFFTFRIFVYQDCIQLSGRKGRFVQPDIGPYVFLEENPLLGMGTLFPILKMTQMIFVLRLQLFSIHPVMIRQKTNA